MVKCNCKSMKYFAYHTSRSLPNGPQTLKRISSLVFNICAFRYLNIDLQLDVKLLVIYPIKNDMSQFVSRLRLENPNLMCYNDEKKTEDQR